MSKLEYVGAPASLPSRERGLKSYLSITVICYGTVAPLAGAWIEMLLLRFHARRCLVAPLAGAWIEIPSSISVSPDRCRRSPRGSVD